MTKQSKISGPSNTTDWRDTIPPIPLTPDEDKEQFETLRLAITGDLDPRGPYEHILVQNIFELEWERWRLRRWRESLLRTHAQYALEEDFFNHAESISIDEAKRQKDHPREIGQDDSVALKYKDMDLDANQVAHGWVYGNRGQIEYARTNMKVMGLIEEVPLTTAYSENLPILNHMERALSQLEVRRRRLLADYFAYQKSRRQSIEDATFLDVD